MPRISLSEPEIRTYYESRVPALKKSGGEMRGPCPIHNGTRDSFAVSLADGKWFCHSQCAKGGDVFALEAELSGTSKDAFRSVLAIVGRELESKRHEVAAYDYTDERGELLYQTVRYEPKDFRQRRPDGSGGWVWKLNGVRLVLGSCSITCPP
jgi:hypothetical protein